MIEQYYTATLNISPDATSVSANQQSVQGWSWRQKKSEVLTEAVIFIIMQSGVKMTSEIAAELCLALY